MKAEHIHNAIGLIDDDILEEKYVKKSKKKLLGGLIGVTTVAAAAIIIAIILPKGNDRIINSISVEYPEKYIGRTEEVAPLEWTKDTWDRSFDPVKYKEANCGNGTYLTCLVATRPENVDKEIGAVEMIGQDYYSGEIRKVTAKAYSIKGVNTECAISVKFNETDKYAYTYINPMYTPDTLGEMLTDLDFRNKVVMGVVYQEIDSDTIAFEELTGDKMWEILFSDTSLVNEPEDKEVGVEVMSVSLTSQTFGIDSMPKTLTLTEDGYMWTNILETRKCFYIGKDKVEMFKQYVVSNGKGYKYIFEYLDEITGVIPE